MKYLTSSNAGYAKALKVLSILTLVFSAISCLSNFGHYYYDTYGDYTPTLRFGFNMNGLITTLIALPSAILLCIYAFKFHEKSHSTTIVAAVFALSAPRYLSEHLLTRLIFALVAIIICFFVVRCENKYSSRKLPTIIVLVISLIANLLQNYYLFSFIGLLVIALHGATFIFTILHNKHKAYAIAGLSLIILLQLYQFSSSSSFDSVTPLYVYHDMAYYVSRILMLASLLLAVFDSKAVAATPSVQAVDPEQALVSLIEQFQNGMITEEEYSARRAEIIDML